MKPGTIRSFVTADARKGADDPAPIIGIDLGMTSVIAAYVPGPNAPPKVIPSERGASSLPAVVGFKAGKGAVVGKAAQDMLTTAPADTVTGVKRLLGRKATSQAVRDLQARVGFRIVPDGDGVAIEVGGERLSPSEVAGLLLTQVRVFAEGHLGRPVKECVVAVPAYFNAQQKEAVKDAARRAKLEVVKIVHEPTAVALAYGYNKSGDSRILILDMGGIRLDVSVMEITGNVFDVVATGGDAYLGGANLDARITEWILTQIKKKFGKDLAREAPLLMKVRTAAEQAKRELSKFKAVDLQIPLEVGQKGKKPQIGALRLPKDTVEKLAEDLVARVINLVNHVLEERGLSAGDIDDVLLVGGGTRLPLLKNKLKEMFGKEPKATLPPEEVISLGAALLAESLRRGDTAPSDILKEPIGIALADGRFMRIIDKDSKLPITRRVMIPTTRDKQRAVEVDLFQGESDDLLNTEYLGTVVYEDIPEAKAGEAKIVVDLVLGMNRMLIVTSPEEGRDGEKFEIKTKEHESVKSGAAIEPMLAVAKNRPERPSEAKR
ncbi:MAG: Hsp70 family protein [Deltaproteobacteria bacterium]|nr:Hsp70 family protein [Deltaproteobacteria bacterium]